MITAIIIFVLTYVLMLLIPKFRPYIALCSALLFCIIGFLPLNKIFSYVNFNVLLMLCGTMGTVGLVTESGMPARMADGIISKVQTIKGATILLSVFSGIISAFIDNVATVLMLAPIAMEISKKQNVNPVKMIIAISVASNLQGAATLVGDTTSIMLGGYAGMNFLDFFWYKSRPGIFFSVELGALVSTLLLFIIFRKAKQKVLPTERTQVSDYVPTYLLGANILLLIIASLLPGMPDLINGYICMGILVINCIYYIIKEHSFRALKKIGKSIDYETLLLLFGLFIVIGGITEAGVVSGIASLFTKLGNGNLFVIYTVIVWASVLISAFIDNIPYVATMLPIVKSLALNLGVDPTLLYFGLLCGATLGGNLTPIGASANIAGIGILRKDGFTVRNSDFLKIGVPFTLSAIIPAYIYLLIFYY